ncbi:MAG: hypothetical protein AWT59_1199 [Candidatus Gallionella acididurans]|uniref:Uncharacterized protein n=1 Tax=Candidatus Gallionella acididurans TaxID=1796491 RepID=A0A139BUN8_9PROT|nr:MAG: hypothetical protein AWT59_1199 [Candidatus Gallionella acididurans]
MKATMPFALAALLSGCGGATQYVGSPFSPLTGVFSDAPVTGLDYRTSSGAGGKTDAQGHFNFAYGDAVTFSVGGLMLGSAIPLVTPAGTAPVTPVDLYGWPTSYPLTQLIGQTLGTLNSIAIDRSIVAGMAPASGVPPSSGVFTIPGDVAAMMAPLVNMYLFPPYYYPFPFLSLFSFTPGQVLAQLQTVASAEGGIAGVPSASDATLNMNQGVNAANVIDTVWYATPLNGNLSGTFYFQPDGNMTGFTSDGNIMAGTWAASTTPGAPVQFALMSSSGNYSGSVASGASTATISDSSGNPAYSITKVTVNTLILSNLYQGGWFGVYTPLSGNTTGVYGAGTPVYFILSPDGTFSGIMDGDQANTGIIGGTWNAGSYSLNTGVPTSGIGTGKFLGSAGTGTFSFNMASQTGNYSISGNVVGTISFSRTGVLAMNSSTGTMTSLLLPVNISWPASPADLHSNFALELSITGSSGVAASGIKAVVNPLGNGGPGYMMAGSISIPYPGTAQNYTLTVNSIATPANCNIAGVSSTSGTVSSNPLPPVSITCN